MSNVRKKSKRPRIPPKRLREVWDKVPKMIDCKGKCVDSCGPVPASQTEHELIEERAGKSLAVDRNMRCVMLKNGRCSVYSIRPLICRLWGATEMMPCVHGCKPERMLTQEESLELFKELEDLLGEGGDEAMARMVEGIPPGLRPQWRRSATKGTEKMVADAKRRADGG